MKVWELREVLSRADDDDLVIFKRHSSRLGWIVRSLLGAYSQYENDHGGGRYRAVVLEPGARM